MHQIAPYGNYAYPSKGNPLEVRAPDKPGDYLLRYHLANTYRVIGSVPLKVGGVAASLKFPEAVGAGSTLSVTWTGPGKKGDFISIDAVGANDRTYGNYAYPERGNPIEVRVPDAPADYVVRYHLASSYGVIGSAPLKVEAVTASLTAPAKVPARSVFEVTWKGPNNPGDFITVVAPTAKEKDFGASNGYTQRGNPVRLEAPREAGNYELRYITGQSNRTLAKTAMTVAPSAERGKLRVVTESTDATGAFAAVEFVLDASGSMLQKLGGVRRIDLAKSALTDLASNALPDGTRFRAARVRPQGGRLVPHRPRAATRADRPQRGSHTDQGPRRDEPREDADRRFAAESSRRPEGRQGSHARRARDRRRGDLRRRSEGGHPVIAFCRTRRARQHRGLRRGRGGAEGNVSRVGARRQWRYFDAQNGEQLKNACERRCGRRTRCSPGGKVISTGTVNGDPIEIPAGSYKVRIPGAAAKDIGEVAVEGGALRELKY